MGVRLMSDEKLNEAPEKLQVNYGHGVISVPASVLPKLKGAKKQDIIILLELLAKPDSTVEELAEVTELGPAAVDVSLAFWRGTGIISYEEGDVAAVDAQTVAEKEPVPQKKSKELSAVPLYSALEVAKIIDSEKSISNMLDDCERTLGKMFGQTDNQRIISVMNYFGLEPAFILLTCAHCAKIGQKSVGYVVSMVSSLCEKGINTVDALSEYLFSVERLAELETQIRKMFGMNMNRALTAKEKAFIGEWADKFGYGLEIIQKAYEITVDTIQDPSIKYTNAILESWYTKDLKTVEQIDSFLLEEKKQKAKGSDKKSFDSEDFFTAALERSYGSADKAPKVENTGTKDKRNYGVGGRK